MNRKHAKNLLCIITCIVVLLLSLTSQAVSVSPALDIIAADFALTKVSLVSRDVYFETADFTSATGLKDIDGIRIVSLPDSKDGTLMLGNIAISENQRISKKNLPNLRFVPRNSKECETTFYFSLDSHKSGAYPCTVFLLERENSSPVIQNGVKKVASTYANMPVFGKLRAYDNENDPLSFEIVTNPVSGNVEITDKLSGSFRYTPDNGYTGSDSFEYIARDKYGNVSDPAKISVNVYEPDTNIVFSDLDSHWAHYGAIKATLNGVMDFYSDNGTYTFMPDAPMSRAEFCASLMKSAGYSGFTSVNSTGYADDDEIPEKYKGYIAAASILGITNGISENENISFYPNNQITRAEAAVMVERLYGFSRDIEAGALAAPTFNDRESVPAWAEQSLMVLSSIGILSGDTSGNISPYSGLSRAEAAVMLTNISELD